MFTPITLTEYGDVLLTPSQTNPNDKDLLFGITGSHQHCEGEFALFEVSQLWRRIRCRRCCLVVNFSSTVRTYSDLRKYFANKLNPKTAVN